MSRPAPAVVQALAKYKRACANDPRIRHLDLRRLAGIEPGPHETELDLLDFAVAPSLHDESKRQATRTATLVLQLDDPALPPAARRALKEELSRLQEGRWNHYGGRGQQASEPISFAEALSAHPRLTVIGDPGAGKTVLTRLAFLACTDGEAGARARALLCDDDRFNRAAVEAVEALRELLPVRLTLGRLGTALSVPGELSIEELIRQQLRAQKVPELLEGLGEMLEAGKLFLLCDGLDEVPERQRRRVVDALTEFFEQYPEVRLLVTSRPNGYQPRVPRLTHALLAPLHPRQQRALVTRLHRLIETREGDDTARAARARRRTNALLRKIQPGMTWHRLGGNPLLLTLSALTPTDDDGSPRHEVFVFENFMRTLLGEWRSVMDLPEAEVDSLMEVWSAVAIELVRQEQRGGGVQALFFRLLDEVARKETTAPSIPAKTALRLALDTGLLQQEGDALVFWHSTFAEFLAARALVRHGEHGTAERILGEERLPPLVLRFAAALLDHVCGAKSQVAKLVTGLLDRDRRGAGQLLRPGLRAVSDCLGYGLRLDSDLTERVWSTWAELLGRTPPSTLWEDFTRLARNNPASHLPVQILDRFAKLQDRGVREVRAGVARLIAPLAAGVPAAQERCAQWLKHNLDTELNLYGALGLASAGMWKNKVIEVLSRFGGVYKPEPDTVGARVLQGGEALQKELKELVRMRVPAEEAKDEQKNEHARRNLQISAACLLAAARLWDRDVAEVLKLALKGSSDINRHDDAATVVKHLAELEPVQDALLEWMGDDSVLGERTRKIVQEVAPVLEGMTEEVLKRTASASPEVRAKLEELLTGLGEEWRSLLDTLRRWLEEPQPERRMCAARLLLRFTPDDDRLPTALRRGMQSPDDATRARWARLAVDLGPELARDAMVTLQSCARSKDTDVRDIVYERMHLLMSRLNWELLDGWIECARASNVPAEARLAAAKLVSGAPSKDKSLVVPILYELLDDGEPTIRLRASHELLSRHEVKDARVVAVNAEETARAITTNEDEYRIWSFRYAKGFATTAVQAILRGLPDEAPPTAPEKGRLRITPDWYYILKELVVAEPSSVEHVLNALDRRGLAGEAARGAILHLTSEQAFADVLRERIMRRSVAGTKPREMLTLLELGFMREGTAPAAVEASRMMASHELTQGQMEWLAGRLHSAGAQNDATRLWRRVLDGADVELALEAAEALAISFPHEASDWVQPTLLRVLKATEPSLRVDAARVALWCGVLEEEARTVLLDCLDLAGHKYERRQTDWFYGPSQVIAHRQQPSNLLDNLRCPRGERRIDFEAMHALCVYRPDVGIPRLAAWLQDEEETRFDCAMVILAKREDYLDALQVALTTRFSPSDTKQLAQLIYRRDIHALHLPRLAEQVVVHLTAKPETLDENVPCLRQWLLRYPELWAFIRQQEPERRSAFACLFQYNVPITRDAVLFAVERSLSQDGLDRDMTLTLEQWCKPLGDKRTESEQDESSSAFTETVRGWLCEALLERAPPDDLPTILRFDNLADAAGLPTRKRIDVLRRALSIDIVTVACDADDRLWLFRMQADAAYLLHELGGRDERLLPIFEAAVYAFADDPVPTTVERVKALLSLRPPDGSIQRALVRAMTAANERIYLDEALDVLKRAGFSVEQRIDILIKRLHTRYDSDWLNENRRTEAPHILEAITALGCAPETIAALVNDLESEHGAEFSSWTLKTLSERPELPVSTVAKLLLRAVARDSQEASKQWLERFTSHHRELDYDERWQGSDGDTSFLSRQSGLAKLSQVDDPVLVEAALADLADETAANSLLTLYRRVRANDSPTEADWSELVSRLALEPGDDTSALLAKEWLTLGLWRALEPETVDRLFQP